MDNQKDHTVLITIAVLAGVVLTVTTLILGSVYNHNSNVDRDKYFADHCTHVSSEKHSNGYVKTTKYKCGE